MNTQDLIQKLEARGITLSLAGKNLHYTAAKPIPAGIVTTIEAHRRVLTKYLKAPKEAGKPTRVDAEPAEAAEPADPRTATAVAVLAEPTEPDNDFWRPNSFPDLAVSFLEAVEGLLVTIKDERPAALLTPQLKRDLKATEAALSAYRVELLPDTPESRAVGQSLANRYRELN
jgi:hypothetical protein